jgi:hypothetical protein
MKPKTEIEIEYLIKVLKQEQARGATKVILAGIATVYTNDGNSVIITTERQF